jgi:membrane-associated phospholipid phosphatase
MDRARSEPILLLATPTCGSHYVVDVVAGMVIAAACWFAVARTFDAARQTRPALTPAGCDPPSIVPETATAARSRKFEPV